MNKKCTINEVAQIFNITSNKIRYYEKIIDRAFVR